MGLFGEVRRQFIARPDDAKNALFCMWPERAIRKFSQLTVDTDDTAVFLLRGKPHAKFKPGRYTMDAAEYPILRELIDERSGEGFFSSELFFVCTKDCEGLFFTVALENFAVGADGRPMQVNAGGEYSLRIRDVEKFFELQQNLQCTRADEFGQFLNTVYGDELRVSMMALLKNAEWTDGFVESNRSRIEHDFIANVNKRVAAYGLEMRALHHFSALSQEQIARPAAAPHDPLDQMLADELTAHVHEDVNGRWRSAYEDSQASLADIHTLPDFAAENGAPALHDSVPFGFEVSAADADAAFQHEAIVASVGSLKETFRSLDDAIRAVDDALRDVADAEPEFPATSDGKAELAGDESRAVAPDLDDDDMEDDDAVREAYLTLDGPVEALNAISESNSPFIDLFGSVTVGDDTEIRSTFAAYATRTANLGLAELVGPNPRMNDEATSFSPRS